MMKKRMFVWMLAFVFVLSMISLTLAQETKPAEPAWKKTVVQEWVNKAKAEVKKATWEDVKKVIDKKENAIILDVRDPDEYAAGHLPGAINVSRGRLEFMILDKVKDQNAKIYAHCRAGDRCALAVKTLYAMGYKNAVAVDAKFEDWVKAGNPVVR